MHISRVKVFKKKIKLEMTSSTQGVINVDKLIFEEEVTIPGR